MQCSPDIEITDDVVTLRPLRQTERQSTPLGKTRRSSGGWATIPALSRPLHSARRGFVDAGGPISTFGIRATNRDALAGPSMSNSNALTPHRGKPASPLDCIRRGADKDGRPGGGAFCSRSASYKRTPRLSRHSSTQHVLVCRCSTRRFHSAGKVGCVRLSRYGFVSGRLTGGPGGCVIGGADAAGSPCGPLGGEVVWRLQQGCVLEGL